MTRPPSSMHGALEAASRAGRGGPTDPSHDEELRRGIIHTRISRRLAWAVALVFLLGIYAVPITQAVLEKVRDEEGPLLDLFAQFPAHESLKQYEKDLEDASYFREAVRPHLQQAVSRFGRFGNSKAVIGRDDWLYYKPGVMHVGGPGFLQDELHRLRRKKALDESLAEPHPDPRPAVSAFASALAARGIKLVLVPVPDKAALQPRELHGRAGNAPVPVEGNPHYRRFVDDARASGALVFDDWPRTLGPGDPPRFLAQDTHWTPAFMEETARALARFVARQVALPAVTAPALATAPVTVQRVGDIVDMLKLPAGQRLFRPHEITVHQVRTAAGEPWAPDEKGDVLLLGDSFSNIFTLGQMGWGEAAGLAPHLALALGRPMDVIAQNDAGAYATRKLLAEALNAGEDRLAGKRVVIWEFAARELSTGDFRPFSYAVGRAP